MSKPTFPNVKFDLLIKNFRRGRRWQVICGDKGHYRVGLFSPEIESLDEIREFEKHSCAEFFILLEGRVAMALMNEARGRQKVRVLELEPLRPVLVRNWHAGFCPNGPFTGIALVVERDSFKTAMKENTSHSAP